jgi:hypothetical protein
MGFELPTLVVIAIGIHYICSCKSNYHTITTTTAPQNYSTSLFNISNYSWLFLEKIEECVNRTWMPAKVNRSITPSRMEKVMKLEINCDLPLT